MSHCAISHSKQESTECTQNLTVNLKLLADLQKHHQNDNKHKDVF